MFQLTLRAAQTLDACPSYGKIGRARALLTFQRYLDSQRACLRKRVCTYAGADWLKLKLHSEGGESRVNCPGFELCEMCQTQVAMHTPGIKLHTLVYDILLPTTAITGYTTGFRKLPANTGAQIAVSL